MHFFDWISWLLTFDWYPVMVVFPPLLQALLVLLRLSYDPQWLVRKRRRLDWTQEDLAEKIGVDPRSIQRWEAGEVPSAANLYKLLQAFADRELIQMSMEEATQLLESTYEPQEVSAQ